MPTLEAVQQKVRARCKEIPQLKWRRLSEYSIVSDCGQFYVGKVSVLGVVSYEVWFKSVGGSAIQLRMNLPTGDDARAWASSIANAYRKGTISLKVPPSKQEVDRLKALQ